MVPDGTEEALEPTKQNQYKNAKCNKTPNPTIERCEYSTY